jgi:hypothetical protein
MLHRGRFGLFSIAIRPITCYIVTKVELVVIHTWIAVDAFVNVAVLFVCVVAAFVVETV